MFQVYFCVCRLTFFCVCACWWHFVSRPAAHTCRHGGWHRCDGGVTSQRAYIKAVVIPRRGLRGSTRTLELGSSQWLRLHITRRLSALNAARFCGLSVPIAGLWWPTVSSARRQMRRRARNTSWRYGGVTSSCSRPTYQLRKSTAKCLRARLKWVVLRGTIAALELLY